MLKNKSGKIVNITSVAGHTGNSTGITASKAGIIYVKEFINKYAKKNININCISPGFIKTAMTDKLDDKFKEAIISKIPSQIRAR